MRVVAFVYCLIAMLIYHKDCLLITKKHLFYTFQAWIASLLVLVGLFSECPSKAFFILNTRKKALAIHSSNKPKKKKPIIPITHRPISLPTNRHKITLYDKLTKFGIPIIQTTSQTIKNLTNITKWTKSETTFHAGIYSIPFKDCNKHYTGETQFNLEKRIYGH